MQTPFPTFWNFNPRPPRGERPGQETKEELEQKFQSTPSARRATRGPRVARRVSRFQSTPSARRATGFEVACGLVGFISIHALREESDDCVAAKNTANIVFQSTPSARRATSVLMPCSSGWRFQSTPSARRATHDIRHEDAKEVDFNPRPPRGERRRHGQKDHGKHEISIHALREESDRQRPPHA